MKKLLLVLAVAFSVFHTFGFPTEPAFSPLQRFSNAWNDQKYAAANTAKDAVYMSENERQVIYILNLVRMNPVLFEQTVLAQYPNYKNNTRLKQSSYFKSLSATLTKMNSLSILSPNKTLFESAKCHAETSGNKSYVGHERISAGCKSLLSYAGECISYGHSDPLDIVMALLIDENVPDLGHRINFLGNFKTIGVSIQPHKSYRYNTVIDLGS